VIVNSATIMVVIGVLGIAGALFFFWAGLRMRSLSKKLAEHGVSGEAEITARDIQRTVQRGRSSPTFYVTFRFEVAGPEGTTAAYTQRQQVKGDTYAALREGAKVPILYLPTNPAGTAQLAGGDADSNESTGAFAYGGGCLIGAVLLLIVAGGSTFQTGRQTSATTVHLSTASGDLAVIRAALEPHFPEWQKITDRAAHRVLPAEVGLGNVKLEMIVYGYCAGGVFYVYAPMSFQIGRTPDVHYSDAYAYTSKPDDFCWPPGWLSAKQGDLGAGWFLTTVVVMEATPTVSAQ
jgi:hypothetical protein